MANNDDTQHSHDPHGFDRVAKLVAQRAPRHPHIADFAYTLVIRGRDPESAVNEAIAREEASLIKLYGLEDREDLLAYLHPMASDRRLQVRIVEALRSSLPERIAEARRKGLPERIAGLPRSDVSPAQAKAARLDALRSIGIGKAEIEAAYVAPIEYSTAHLGDRYEALEACDEQGDEVGVARERKRTRRALQDLDELRRDPHAVEVPPRDDAEGRAACKREDEARALASSRTNMARGYLVGLLMGADLSTEESAEPFFHNFSTAAGPLPSPACIMHEPGAGEREQLRARLLVLCRAHVATKLARPSLEQLRLAKAIACFLDAAIMSGDDASHWALVKRAYDALDATLAKRCAVVAILSDLSAYHEREIKELGPELRQLRAKRPDLGHAPGTGTEFRASKALESLTRQDSRFASVCVRDLVALVRTGRLAPLGMAAKLSLSCGAFEDAKRENESDAAAFKRVKKLYEKAV
jgi:hypothetical protein